MDIRNWTTQAIFRLRTIVVIALMVGLLSCNHEQSRKELTSSENQMSYAKGFSISHHENYKLIEVSNAWRGEGATYKYVLYENEMPEDHPDAIKVKVPIKKIACMSLTHLSFIEALGQEETIIAISGSNYSNSKKIGSLIASKQIVEVGSEQQVNYESLIDKAPDIVMTYGIDQSSANYIAKFERLGLLPIMNAEYMETHPLGKAEWIKFVAAFYNLDEQADSIFNHISKSYNELIQLTEDIDKRPSVLVGMPWQGNWYVAGGKSFQAKLLEDAGSTYLWAGNEEKSSVVKSKELVIDEGLNADFWLNQNSYASLAEILEFDQRLGNFKAVKNKAVYNNNKRLNVAQGNDYWESGTMNPHIILKDLIEIFHPDLQDHQLYYYKKLE